MELSERLKTIADLVDNCDLLADIGTDHAYIPVYLIKKGVVKRAIAADISKGSIKKAELNAKKYNCIDKIDLRCGNGLEVIKAGEQPNCVVIAGMGGMLAIEVMEKNIPVVKGVNQLIVQPQRDIDEVRKFLHKIGLKIENEKMLFEDGKFYNVIICSKGVDVEYSETDYWFGKRLIDEKNKVLKEYIFYEMNKMNRVLESLKDNKELHIIERKNQLEEKYNKYREVFEWLG